MSTLDVHLRPERRRRRALDRRRRWLLLYLLVLALLLALLSRPVGGLSLQFPEIPRRDMPQFRDSASVRERVHATNLSGTMTLLTLSRKRHSTRRRWQLAQGSSPVHLILLWRQATHL